MPRRGLLPLLALAAMGLPAAQAAGCSDDPPVPETHKPTLSECGNGEVEQGEQCDDGNDNDSDGCTARCEKTDVSTCGDGATDGVEECDDGNFDDTDACVAGCVAAYCGDGLVQAGVEQCDDGNTDDGDACSSNCEAGTGCGNGIVEAGEECDDGNSVPTDDCLPDCTKPVCGDGQVQLGAEECDDGNQVDDDTCSNACTVNMGASYTCPGLLLTVENGLDTTVSGDTSLSQDNWEGDCGGGSAPDVVYEVLALDSGTLEVSMQGLNGSDPVLYAAGDDCATGPFLGCSDSTFAGGTETIVFPVTSGKSYWVFADGYQGTAGPYLLKAHLQTGTVGDLCPGAPVSISKAADVDLQGNTATAAANYKGTGACDQPSTKEIVYSVTPTVSGKLFVSLDPNYDGALYARVGTCTLPANQIACADAGGNGAGELISFNVTANTKYSVFVDGHAGSAGTYSVNFHLQ